MSNTVYWLKFNQSIRCQETILQVKFQLGNWNSRKKHASSSSVSTFYEIALQVLSTYIVFHFFYIFYVKSIHNAIPIQWVEEALTFPFCIRVIICNINKFLVKMSLKRLILQVPYLVTPKQIVNKMFWKLFFPFFR